MMSRRLTESGKPLFICLILGALSCITTQKYKGGKEAWA